MAKDGRGQLVADLGISRTEMRPAGRMSRARPGWPWAMAMTVAAKIRVSHPIRGNRSVSPPTPRASTAAGNGDG